MSTSSSRQTHIQLVYFASGASWFITMAPAKPTCFLWGCNSVHYNCPPATSNCNQVCLPSAGRVGSGDVMGWWRLLDVFLLPAIHPSCNSLCMKLLHFVYTSDLRGTLPAARGALGMRTSMSLFELNNSCALCVGSQSCRTKNPGKHVL